MNSESSNHNSVKPNRANGNNTLWLFPIILIALCIISFFAGKAYEKGHVKTTASSTTSRFGNFSRGGGGMGGFGGGQRPSIGKVTAISSTSITVDSTYSGSSKTYTINSSTTVTNDGSSSSVSAIQTGDSVLVRTSSSSSATASTIELNPSFGHGPGAQPGSSTTGSATNDSEIDTN